MYPKAEKTMIKNNKAQFFVRSQIISCLLQITLFVLKDIEFNTFL